MIEGVNDPRTLMKTALGLEDTRGIIEGINDRHTLLRLQAEGGGGSPTAPIITVDPSSSSIDSGESVALSVTATGSSPKTYQWYQGSSGDTSVPVGTNSNHYTTPALVSLTRYWVRVTNTTGHDDSATATITINSTGGGNPYAGNQNNFAGSESDFAGAQP